MMHGFLLASAAVAADFLCFPLSGLRGYPEMMERRKDDGSGEEREREEKNKDDNFENEDRIRALTIKRGEMFYEKSIHYASE